MTNEPGSPAGRDVDIIRECGASRGPAMMRKRVQVVVVAHTLDKKILLVLEKATHHRVAGRCLQGENSLAVGWPRLSADGGMSCFVLRDRAHAVKVLAVNEEWRMCRVDELILLSELLKKGN